MKVLLVRFSSLGDVILLSSLFDGLRKEEVEFDVLTDSDYAELFKWDDRVNNVLEISDYSLSSLRRVAEKVNALNYDYVFDLHCVLKVFGLKGILQHKNAERAGHSNSIWIRFHKLVNTLVTHPHASFLFE